MHPPTAIPIPAHGDGIGTPSETPSTPRSARAGTNASEAGLPPGLAARLLRAHDEECLRITNGLHDDISQRIALVAIGVDKLCQELAVTHPDASAQLALVLEHAQDLGEGVRRLSHDLHSTNLDHLGLRAAVRTHCEEFTAGHGIGVDLRCVDVPAVIPEDVARALFRIVQEALRNVARHSGAKSAIVEINGAGDDLRVRSRIRGSAST